MKKFNKAQLGLDKEVIACLSNSNLEELRGGAGPDTFNSNCICLSVYEKTCAKFTQGPNCKVGVSRDSRGDVCCALPGASKAGGICPFPTDTIKVQTADCSIVAISKNNENTCGCHEIGYL